MVSGDEGTNLMGLLGGGCDGVVIRWVFRCIFSKNKIVHTPFEVYMIMILAFHIDVVNGFMDPELLADWLRERVEF